MSLYYPEGSEAGKGGNSQSLLSVYLHSLVYYDHLFSNFAIVFQYFIFVYKYNILSYVASTVAAELVLLTLLLPLNYLRIAAVRAGNRGKRQSFLAAFLVIDVLLVVGCVYIVALQTNALYLEVIISIIELVLAGANLVLAVILMIMYSANP